MGPALAKHLKFMMDVADRTAPTGDARYGMIAAFGDAAHLCDAIAADIRAVGRPSKAREREAEAVERCAQHLWDFRSSLFPRREEP